MIRCESQPVESQFVLSRYFTTKHIDDNKDEKIFHRIIIFACFCLAKWLPGRTFLTTFREYIDTHTSMYRPTNCLENIPEAFSIFGVGKDTKERSTN